MESWDKDHRYQRILLSHHAKSPSTVLPCMLALIPVTRRVPQVCPLYNLPFSLLPLKEIMTHCPFLGHGQFLSEGQLYTLFEKFSIRDTFLLSHLFIHSVICSIIYLFWTVRIVTCIYNLDYNLITMSFACCSFRWFLCSFAKLLWLCVCTLIIFLLPTIIKMS